MDQLEDISPECSERGNYEIWSQKPSLTKSINARTKGAATRAVKKMLIPGYGQKGRG